MQVTGRGAVFLGAAGSEYASACFPGVCVLPDGTWLVGFRAAPRKQDAGPQRFMLTRSDNGGRTWTNPAEPFAPEHVDGRPGAWRAGQMTALGGRRVAVCLYWVDTSDPALPFFNERTEGLLDSRIFLAVSEDAGLTWTRPRLLDTSPYDMPTPITGPILPLANGEWALQFETNKTYHDTTPWQHRSVLMFSGDEGRTWPASAETATDPAMRVFYWDQRPGLLADGSLLDLFWTFDRQTAAYRNIHARRSTDHGRTWGELWDTGVPGQPGPPVSLPDGRIAMPYVDREGKPVLKLRTSADGGRCWPAEGMVVLDDRLRRPQQREKTGMQDAWAEMGAFSLGLPATARLPEGDVLVVYYAGLSTDHTGIHWVRIRSA